MLRINDSPFLGESISDNLQEHPDGYLIALNVKIARTGTQQYSGQEMGITERPNDVFTAYRLPEDVFAEQTMKSAEAAPVTNNHPPTDVKPENYHYQAKGHAQNIRRDGNYIVADLVITDPTLIEEVKSKVKREVSCGYSLELTPYKGGFKQQNIRINHIAVVPQGRAGSKVSIVDSLPVAKTTRRIKPMSKQDLLAQIALTYAKAEDATPEGLALLIEGMGVTPEPKAKAKDENASLLAAFGNMFGAASKAKAKDEDEEKKAEDEDEPTAEEKKAEDRAFKKRVADEVNRILKAKDDADNDGVVLESGDIPDTFEEIVDEALEGEMEKKAEDEDEETAEEKKASDAALFKSLVNAIGPSLAKLPAAEQKRAKDALVKTMGRKSGGNYGKIRDAVTTHSKDYAAAANAAADPSALGKSIMNNHNLFLAAKKSV